MGRLSDKTSTKLDCDVTLINVKRDCMPKLCDLVQKNWYQGAAFSLSTWQQVIDDRHIIFVVDGGLIFLRDGYPVLISRAAVLTGEFAPSFNFLIPVYCDIRLHFPARQTPSILLTAEDIPNNPGIYTDLNAVAYRRYYRIGFGGELYLLVVSDNIIRICNWANVAKYNENLRYFSEYVKDFTLTFHSVKHPAAKHVRPRCDIQAS